MLMAQNLQFGYVKGSDVIKGVDVTLGTGRSVCVLGPNGSGKSTLLKLLSGELAARSGSISVLGQDVTALPMHRRVQKSGVACVPQIANIFRPMSVAENLEIGGWVLSPSERRQRIEEVMEMFPLIRTKAGSSAGTLSGGERQLLAFARALMSRPKLVLLDEPSAGLSPKMTQEFFAQMKRVQQAEGISVLLVEQNATAGLNACDRGILIVSGEKMLDEPSQDILALPNLAEIYLTGGSKQAERSKPQLVKQ